MKIDIDLYAQGFIVRLSLTALFLDVIHSLSALFAIDLKFFDLVQTAGLFGKSASSTTLVALPNSFIIVISSAIALISSICISRSWYSYNITSKSLVKNSIHLYWSTFIQLSIVISGFHPILGQRPRSRTMKLS